MERGDIPNIEEVTGDVLIVDDKKKTRDMLKDMLRSEGHDTELAKTGEEALDLLEECQPDLILLDIMMPGIDGIEVCKQVKSDKKQSHIPIILITALNSNEVKLKGMKAGADEFLSKPISLKNVKLRARNLMYSHKLYNRVVEDYHKLEQLQELRDNLIHMIVHDMKSPLTGVKKGIQVIKNKISDNVNEIVRKLLNRIEMSINRLIDMVNSMLEVNKFESNTFQLNKQETEIVPIIKESINTHLPIENKQNIEIKTSGNNLKQDFDPEIIRRIVDNLLSNAIDFTPADGKIDIEVKKENDNIKVSVKDNGPGIPEEYQEKIFKKFGQVEAGTKGKKYSVGLGLTFCKLAIEAHGGEIGVESEEGEGSKFWFKL